MADNSNWFKKFSAGVRLSRGLYQVTHGIEELIRAGGKLAGFPVGDPEADKKASTPAKKSKKSRK